VRSPRLTTERLLLRRWRPQDLEPFAALNADAAVMEYFPATLSSAQSAAMIERHEGSFAARGYGLWAVEHTARAQLIGAVGLVDVDLDVAFAPSVEVGWRLARAFWEQGLAAEAAAAALGFGFERLELARIVAYTAAVNHPSRRLMERLGMRRDPAEDFAHPGIAASDPLAPHVLYRIDAPLRRSASGADFR
jgi:RimJ/RimL family protein N-acetyltransferase